MTRLEGRLAIVSGGARGIGAAHVRALAGEGAHVVIGDVLAGDAAALAQTLGERVRAIPLDVTSEAEWEHAVSVAEAEGWAPGPVTPGVIRTAMTDGAPEAQMSAKYPMRRFGTPEEVAATMLFIVFDATYATGGAFPIDGGIMAGIKMGE